jgi:hypothetical protein
VARPSLKELIGGKKAQRKTEDKTIDEAYARYGHSMKGIVCYNKPNNKMGGARMKMNDGKTLIPFTFLPRQRNETHL